MSCPQPTAQYGQTPANAFASLILSETAAASTGSMSTPAPSAPAVAVAPPYFRKSRRERLIQASLSPLWTRELVPDSTDDHDAPWSVERSFEFHDVARVEGAKVRAALGVIADDEGLLRAREVGTGVRGALDPNDPSGGIHCDDDVAILLQGVRKTHPWPPARGVSALKPVYRTEES